MAKALASPSYEKDLQEVNHFESDYNSDNDSEADEDETEDSPQSRSPRSQSSRGHSPSKDVHSRNTPESQQNGTVMMQFDRYGFVGGKEFTDPDEERRVPIEVIRKREIKWLDMFQNWEKWMSKRFKKVKERCRKGIPPSVRSRAWQYLCGSKFLMDHNVGKFDEYLKHPGDPKWIDDIKKDLHRQFPLHEMFMARGGYGQEDLFRILKAYTIHNPRDGYCQAQGPLAAVLLMHMPAEEAFWCFVSICDKYLPGYYSTGLVSSQSVKQIKEAIQVDGDVLFGLLKKTNPPVYKHLKKHRVEPILYMTEWFMCVFSRTLPWSCVLRVWDMFFCEGVKVVFRVALVLVRTVLGSQESLKSSPGLYETLEKLRHIPSDVDESYIVRESLRLSITERDMEKEHQKQVQRRKAAKEKQNKPDSKKSNKKRH